MATLSKESLKKLNTKMHGPVSQRVTCYMEPELVTVIDEYADTVGLKRAGAIRRAVILGLQNDGVSV